MNDSQNDEDELPAAEAQTGGGHGVLCCRADQLWRVSGLHRIPNEEGSANKNLQEQEQRKAPVG